MRGIIAQHPYLLCKNDVVKGIQEKVLFPGGANFLHE